MIAFGIFIGFDAVRLLTIMTHGLQKQLLSN